jgi:dihydrofolate synthase/folylpolyglutamate synthase
LKERDFAVIKTENRFPPKNGFSHGENGGACRRIWEKSVSQNYESTIRFLEDRTNYERVLSIPYDRMAENLDRLGRFATFLRIPRRARVVRIAGTKGKGSTALILEKMIRDQGYRTGLFTSPHLFRWEERFALDGVPCTAAELAGALSVIKEQLDAFDKLDPGTTTFTTFELTVVTALFLFEKKKCDFILWETGLGGRYDATAICAPDLCILTSLGYEHQKQLGETLVEIAAEKGGIIKPHIPVISGVGIGLESLPPEETLASLPKYLRKRTVTRRSLQEGLNVIREIAMQEDAPLISLSRVEPDITEAAAHLIGNAQKRNAQIAFTALETLGNAGFLSVDRSAALDSLAGLTLPARGQVARRNPCWILDGAHTRDSAAALATALGQLDTSRKTLVFATLAEKDAEGMFWELFPKFHRVFLTEIPDMPRSLAASELFRRAKRVLPDLSPKKRPSIKARIDFAHLLDEMNHLPKEELVCFTGSFYLVGKAVAYLEKWRESSG